MIFSMIYLFICLFIFIFIFAFAFWVFWFGGSGMFEGFIEAATGSTVDVVCPTNASQV